MAEAGRETRSTGAPSPIPLNPPGPARRRSAGKPAPKKPRSGGGTESIRTLARWNRRLTSALLIAGGLLLFQGWTVATSRMTESTHTRARMAVLTSIAHKQQSFMRLHNRYAGALDVLRLPGVDDSGVKARVVTFNTRDGPAFLAEACNAGGCTTMDNLGNVRQAARIHYLVPPSAKDVSLTAAPDPEADTASNDTATPTTVPWGE